MGCSSSHLVEGTCDTKQDSTMALENGLNKLSLKSPPVSSEASTWMAVDVDQLMLEEGFDADRLEDFKWWNVVDKMNSVSPITVNPDTKRKTWKTVRLFVSSTFKDMNSEREHLVKQVFPQLRQWCEGRKLRLIECDLRWGIPKDADTSQTFIGCLSQIDRCREENECPYFLCMLSERYGWCPKPGEVPDHIKSKYKWMPGVSVTSLEVFTGAYWDHNPNAVFMLRDSGFLNDVKNPSCLKACTENDEAATESVSVLKGKLRERFPRQVFEYRGQVADRNSEVLQLSNLEDFGQTVLENFKSLIDRQYPTDSLGESLSLSEMQRTEHENFMIQRSQVLLGRDDILMEIREYIREDNSEPTSLVLVGSPGAGKSAVMAYSAKEFSVMQNYQTFFHFVGATPGSTDLYQILTRLWTDLAPAGEQTPSDLDEIVRSMDAMFVRAAKETRKEGRHRLIVFIDALNQMDQDGDAQDLRWLPDSLPENMRVVVSTLDGRCRQALASKKSPAREVVVEPLNMDIRKQIVTKILAEYSKALDHEQLAALVSKPDAGRPLWLSVACEELRVFGSFIHLLQKIVDLPGELTGLLHTVLNRIISSYGGELVVATLCLIERSRFGLLETELVELLTLTPVLPSLGVIVQGSLSKGDKLPMAQWARIFLGLKQYLRPSGNSGEGRLDFYHRTISKVVRSQYLADPQTVTAWHTRLAGYFENCSDLERKAEELPYHCVAIGDMERLKSCLLQQEVFSILYQERTKLQLMKYWQHIGGYEIAAQAYVDSLQKYIHEHNLVDIDDIEPVQVKVAWFLLDIGQYDTSQALLEEVYAQVQQKYGDSAKLLANCLTALVTLFYRHGLKFVYGSNPGFSVCMESGRRYGKQCIQVYKKHWGPGHQELGRTLGLCGYFCREVLNEAREILEAHNDRQNLASLLSVIGEKNQYHDNMSVPIELFEQSIDLCKSEFGKFHLKTARSYQLYGQLYWNRWVSVPQGERKAEWMETCLELYKDELEILEELLGETHPTTVRSREDVIIIMQTLGMDKEAAVLSQQQPEEHDAV